MSTQNFLVAFAFVMFFVGYYVGTENQSIDYVKGINEITSCAPYENEFLYTVGFSGKEDCQKFNLELKDEYKTSCLDTLEKTGNASYDEKSLNACVYYSFEKARTSFNSKYFVFQQMIRETGANNR